MVILRSRYSSTSDISKTVQDRAILHKAARKSHMIHRMMPFSMTLNYSTLSIPETTHDRHMIITNH